MLSPVRAKSKKPTGFVFVMLSLTLAQTQSTSLIFCFAQSEMSSVRLLLFAGLSYCLQLQ